jgi:hypothetical protein
LISISVFFLLRWTTVFAGVFAKTRWQIAVFDGQNTVEAWHKTVVMRSQIAGEKFATFSDLFSGFPILGMNQDSALAEVSA